MSNRVLALIAVFTVQLFYGLNFTFANDIIDAGIIKPYGFILIRIFGATALFWLLSLFTPKQKIDKKDFKTLFIASIFGVALNMLTFFKGFEYTSPINASVIMITVPIIVLVFSAIYLKERVTSINILGIALGFTGAILLSVYGKSSQDSDNVMLGNFLVFINAVSYSIYIIIIKKLTAKYHPFTFIKWLFLIGCFLVLPFGYNEFMAINWSSFTNYTFFSVGFVIVCATFGTYLLNPIGLRHLKASTVGTFIYLQPVIAGIFALIMGSDTINTVKLSATALIFCGVYLVTKKAKPIT